MILLGFSAPQNKQCKVDMGTMEQPLYTLHTGKKIDMYSLLFRHPPGFVQTLGPTGSSIQAGILILSDSIQNELNLL